MTESERGAPPLQNIRVLELGRWFAAPWAAQILSDLGAEVIKVESSDGDPMRSSEFLSGSAIVRDAEGRPTSDQVCFVTHNRNKQSIIVDLTMAEGQEVVRQLAAQCDVFIENFKPGDLARRNLDYAAISALNPEIVYLSLSGFGESGPYMPRPGMDGVAQAMSGFVSLLRGEGPPQLSTLPVMDFAAGMYAAVGVLGALYGRDAAGGRGQHIELALLESSMAMMSMALCSHLLSGITPDRRETPRQIPSEVFATQDGNIYVAGSSDANFAKLCEAADIADAAHDPRFRTVQARAENYEAVKAEVARALARRTTAEWVEAFTRAKLLHAPVNNLAEVVADPHVKAREIIFDIEHAAGGRIPMVRNPLRFSHTPVERYTSPPLHGQHTQSVLAEKLGLDDEAIRKLRESGAVSP